MINILANGNSLFDQYIAEIRDVKVQGDSMRFRRNLERMGEIMAYEISKTLEWQHKIVTTPLGHADSVELVKQPVIASILRAGLPLHQGLLNYFDKGENA